MKFLPTVYAVLLASLIISCEKVDQDIIIKDRIEGFVQKGPYINGTSITISELNNKLIPTGQNFNTQIVDNKGSFQLNNIRLNSKYVELKADGFYYNEVSGSTSVAPLTLYALTDISDKSSINVNVLSYLEKARIEYLIGQGNNFAAAKRRAQRDVLNIFSIQKEDIQNSEVLNLSQPGEDNAILLAASVILQGKRSVAELSELLANISRDIKEDGSLDDPKFGTQLINEVKYLDLGKVRQNIQQRYTDLGETATIPDFEKYINQFIEYTDFKYELTFIYPETGTYGQNILSLEDNSILNSRKDYSVSAVVPENSSLKIVIKKKIGDVYHVSTSAIGGEFSNDFQNSSVIFNATRTGEPVEFRLYFVSSGNFQIEIYENNAPSPTITKSFVFNQQNVFSYPESGSNGINLLSLPDGSIVPADQYSFTMNLPDDFYYNITIEIHLDNGDYGATPVTSYTLNSARNENWNFEQSDSGQFIKLSCSGKGITADIPITLTGSGSMYIQSNELNKNIKWK